MAEARNATDIFFLQKRLRSSHDGYITFQLSIPTLTTLAKQASLVWYRTKLTLLSHVWPARPSTILAVMGGVTYLTVTAKSTSWVRSGWLAEALWRADGTMGALVPLHAQYSTQFRVGYLAATASFVGVLGIVSVERFLLRILLSWQGWLFGKPSGAGGTVLTTLWGGLVTALSGATNMTYAFHLALPTLPLPSLAHTVDGFLKSVEPLLDAEEFSKTKELASKFQHGEGASLQRYLWFKWLTSSNYTAEWWEKYCYLHGRTPIMINSNYYILDSKLRPTTNQLQRAAGLCHHFLNFKDQVENETLEPITIRGLIPLCMSQYQRMFSTARVPGRECDSIEHKDGVRHIVVVCRGHYYKLNVYHGASGTALRPYSAEEIETQLELIAAHSKREVNKLPSAAGARKQSVLSGLRRGHRIQSFEDLVVMGELSEQRGQRQGGLTHSASTASFNARVGASLPSAKYTRRGANIAAFTAGPRSRWAEVRELYFSEGVNRKSLSTIEAAAFVLQLDDNHYTTLSDRAHSLFHGSGSNRWFDKSINLVVFEDGYAGLNCEHSFSDAVPLAHLLEYAFLSELHDFQNKRPKPNRCGLGPVVEQERNRANSGRSSPGVDAGGEGENGVDFATPLSSEVVVAAASATATATATAASAGAAASASSSSSNSSSNSSSSGKSASKKAVLTAPKRLLWEIDDELQVAIDQAHAFAAGIIGDLDLEIVEHTAYGKGLVKKNRMSPDSYVQMALQLTYYRLRQEFCCVYESSMTRLFRLGRTETTRSLSVESAAFVKGMETGASKADCVALLREATTVHSLTAKKAMVGKGIDRHLFALYIVSKGVDVSSEFLNAALSMPWRLSSSQQPQDQTSLREGLPEEVVSRFVSPGGGFGPVADDGYGVSYMMTGDEVFFFHISSKFSAPETSSSDFAVVLSEALADMADLFKE